MISLACGSMFELVSRACKRVLLCNSKNLQINENASIVFFLFCLFGLFCIVSLSHMVQFTFGVKHDKLGRIGNNLLSNRPLCHSFH